MVEIDTMLEGVVLHGTAVAAGVERSRSPSSRMTAGSKLPRSVSAAPRIASHAPSAKSGSTSSAPGVSAGRLRSRVNAVLASGAVQFESASSILTANGQRTLARIAAKADGWLGFFLTPNGFRRDAATIDEARARHGRLERPFQRGMLLNFHIGANDDAAMDHALAINLGFAQELTLAGNAEQLKRFALAGRPATIIARLQEYVDAGCTNFALAPMEKGDAEYSRQARRFAAEILPALRAHGGAE